MPLAVHKLFNSVLQTIKLNSASSNNLTTKRALTSLICLISMPLASFAVVAEEVNVYSARQEALIKPLLDEFTADTGIKVNLVTGKGDALIARLKSEGQFSPADLLLVADVGRLVRAKSMGVTQRLPQEGILDIVDAQYQDEDGQWVALTKRARPIMYKLGEFDPSSITSLQDLTKSEFKNSVCIRSSSNIYNQSMVSALIEIWGEQQTLDWAEGLVNNFARSPKGGDRDQIKALVAGQCSVAIANTYYLGGMLASKDKETREIAQQVGVIWHDQSDASNANMGVHVNVSGAVLTKHAKNINNANKLLAYMLTKDSQQWYAQVNHEYPVIEGVAYSKELNKFGEYKAQKVNLSKVGQNNAKALMLMDQAGWK